jgi:hypothetical protein
MESTADLNIPEALGRQYHAALSALGNAAKQCPESAWLDSRYPNRFWHLAYHAHFYTHLYLQQSEKEFIPWRGHRPDYQFLGPTPWPPFEKPKSDIPYSKEEVLDYNQFCRVEVETRLRSMSLSAPSGFHWLPCNKLELQLYNLRHLQHHTGQLIDRMRNEYGIGVAWVSGF